jgi:hypothetical protein
MELQWHGLFAAPVKVQAVEDMGKLDNTLTLECRSESGAERQKKDNNRVAIEVAK